MIFHQIRAGGDRNFSYLAGDTEGGKGALFDPPPDSSLYADLIRKYGLDIEYIVITHGHGDHTWGVSEARRKTSGRVVAYKRSQIKADHTVEDGDVLPLGSLELKFIHTPGHTDDSMCILVAGKLITGDTLFVGKVGGTDYEEGARKEWKSLRDKILTLDDSIEIYPGHDYGIRPTSTIKIEKETNPFILRKTFEEFVELKKNWLKYKREHGID